MQFERELWLPKFLGRNAGMARQSVCARRAVDANALPPIDGFPTLYE
jgi:hypothetical protein